MAENLGKYLPNEGRAPKLRHRMAAEGMQFPWRWNGDTVSLNLGVIWEMSARILMLGWLDKRASRRGSAQPRYALDKMKPRSAGIRGS